MGWVVSEIVQRARREHVYSLSEWEQFCADHGLGVMYVSLPYTLRAFYVANTIVLDPRLEPQERAWWAFHEGYHALYCAGSREEWRQLMVCGEWCLRKMERQADEFAATFPVGEGES